MTPEQYERLYALFTEVIGLEPGRRGAFLDTACAHDSDLRGEIESILAEHEYRSVIDDQSVGEVLRRLAAQWPEEGQRAAHPPAVPLS